MTTNHLQNQDCITSPPRILGGNEKLVVDLQTFKALTRHSVTRTNMMGDSAPILVFLFIPKHCPLKKSFFVMEKKYLMRISQIFSLPLFFLLSLEITRSQKFSECKDQFPSNSHPSYLLYLRIIESKVCHSFHEKDLPCRSSFLFDLNLMRGQVLLLTQHSRCVLFFRYLHHQHINYQNRQERGRGRGEKQK